MQERWDAQWRPVLSLARVGGGKEQVGAGGIPGRSPFVPGAHRCSRLADSQGQAQHRLAFAGTGQFDFKVLSASYVSIPGAGRRRKEGWNHPHPWS